MENDIRLLDETIALIKEKTKDSGFHKFDFYLILCMDIVRYELYSSGKVSDLSGKALNQFSVFQAFEFYHTDYPEIYSKCSAVFSALVKYNNKLQSDELGLIGVRDNQWIDYFQKIISSLILSNPPNNK